MGLTSIYRNKMYESICGFEPDLGNMVVDVGAHLGIYTLKVASQVGTSGKIIAIEPNKPNFSLLTQNIKLNNLSNVVPLNVALANEKRKMRLYTHKDSRAHSIRVRGELGFDEVEALPLDDLLSDLGISKVDLLKINAEGAELMILDGAKDSLDGISRIVVTTHSNELYEGVERFLLANGFLTRKGFDGTICYAWKVQPL